MQVRTRMGSISRARLRRRWLREPEQVFGDLRADLENRGMDAPSLSILAWLALTWAKDLQLAEHAARRALATDPSCRFAAAALAEVLAARSDHDAAVEVLRRVRAANSRIAWYDLTLADALIDAKRFEEAAWVLEEAAERPELRRHALKRLARVAIQRYDLETAISWQAALVDLAPNYLVYASDYLTLARLYADASRPDRAIGVLEKGRQIYPRNGEIRALLTELSGEIGIDPGHLPAALSEIDEERIGARRIAVKTPLITLRSDLARVVDAATAGIRKPGDVIAISESPTAAAQGRLIPLELIRPGVIADLLCRYVGSDGPLHSPEGMQGAILDVGLKRVLMGAVAGAVGRLFGRHGWFYMVAGRSTAMIDDVAACLPPFDHHVIFGPANPDQTATELAAELGNDVAIVDANHITGAWVVGASPGLDRSWVEAVLADNPAGNEDEQTPVVVIQRI